MSKGFKQYLPIWLVAFIATVAIILIVPFEEKEHFYTFYYFSIIAMAIQLIISYFALKNKDKSVSTATFVFSVFGLLALFATNFIAIEYTNNPEFRAYIQQNYYFLPFKLLDMGLWGLIVDDIVVVSLSYILTMAVNINQKRNAERDEHVKEQTNTMLTLTNRVKALYDSTNNEDIYRLYETLKYSDKLSKNTDIEDLINKEIGVIETSSSAEEIKDSVNRAIRLINSR